MKIDTTKIPGFDAMTAEQKAAIIGMEFPDTPDYSGYVKKDLYDKAASDAANWKKKHNELLSEDERRKQEHDEHQAALETELASLRKERTVSSYMAKYMAEGYDEKLARDTATALADGEMDKVFANQSQFLATRTENLKKELLKSTPRTPAGEGATVGDYAKQIAEANERGDMACVAALMRAQQESQNK